LDLWKNVCILMVQAFLFMIDWEQVRIDAAISAMQGVLESGKLGMVLEAAPEVVARQAVKLADALIKEIKGE
jgi:hypothetical protein